MRRELLIVEPLRAMARLDRVPGGGGLRE